MTSGGGTFSPEEIKYLKSLPAVAEATAKRITYTDDFKRYCVVRYNEGASPVRMFREAGLDPALIGYKRIERCLVYFVKSVFRVGGGAVFLDCDPRRRRPWRSTRGNSGNARSSCM
ncbi:hypothetical protein ACR74F_08955, partial [Bifidobacterium longum subsp. longum]